MRVVALLNREGGTLRTTDVEALAARAVDSFEAAGHALEVHIVNGAALPEALAAATADPAVEVILAGGGDGTISTAAGACFRAQKPLAVLPAGTMNFFARSLGVPTGLDQAVEALAHGEIRAVDIATANGTAFVHQYSVGLYARLVQIREGLTYHGRFSKMLASLRAVAGAISRPLVFDVEIGTRSGRRVVSASNIAVSNNPYDEGHIPFAEKLDRGVLGFYVAGPMSRWDMVRIALRVLVGRWKEDPLVSDEEVTEVTLSFPRLRRKDRATIDGELVQLARRVELRIHPGGLKVLAPAAPR